MTQRRDLTIGTLALLLCMSLLAYHFNRFSMWYDEVYIVNGTLKYNFFEPSTFKNDFAQIAHPPLYYISLKTWISLAGESDFSMRLLSIWATLGAGAFVYRLAKDIAQTAFAGASAALILCSFGFIQYYAHETHNYGFFVLFSSMILAFFFRWLKHPASRLYSVGLGVSIVLLMYTHYYSAFLIIGLTVYALIVFRKRIARFRHLLIIELASALAYIPWIPAAYGATFDHYGLSGAIPTGQVTNLTTVRQTFEVMLSGQTLLFAVLIGGTITYALWMVYQHNQRQYLTQALYLVLIPAFAMGIALLINLRYRTFLDRRIIYLLISMAGLSAMSLNLIGQRIRWAVLAVVIGIIIRAGTPQSLPGNWLFRETIEWVNDETPAGSLVVIEVSQQSQLSYLPFVYYADRLLTNKTYVTFDNHTIDNAQKQSVFANEIMMPYIWPQDEFWVLRPDEKIIPQNAFIRTWMNSIEERSYVLKDTQQFGWSQLLHFEATDSPPTYTMPGTLPAVDKMGGVIFGNRIRLHDYDVSSLSVQAGDEIDVWLQLSAIQRLYENYSVALHLREGASLVAQVDDPPIHLGKPIATQFWSQNHLIKGIYRLSVGSEVAPGHYDLYLVIYSEHDGHRLKILIDGHEVDSLYLTSIEIISN